ncbi:MAG: acriflavine resistance protein B [Gammaproteobacteria bacterium SG8_31]|nr:MAG: acriflavine resistance protein B [Gammaproteobacteria bacterium SG8_31]
MNLTRPAIGNPVAVIVGIIMVVMFGVIALIRMPIQMIPNVERPLIEISTSWRAAAPEEVEAEIIEPQEDALRGLPGLEKIESSASRGNASITLYFGVDTRLERSLIEVMNRLNRVPSYPPDVDEPIIYAGRGRFGTAIAWFAIRPLPGNSRDITGYQDFVEEVIQSRVEQIPGIATADIYGGRNREVRITFDPYRASALDIDVPTLARLTGNNTDVSGGFQDVGRRSYTVRFSGKYSVESFNDMVLAWRDGQPVRLYDIATVETVLRDPSGTLNQNGGPSMAMNAQPEQNVNVLEVMDNLKATIAELNEGPVKRAELSITQVYDETIYITDSVAMLRNNLLLGIFLAIAILWWFMRRFRATMMVALAIPVSLFITFVVLNAAGRSINIISLAGLAFAVGMVLDAAIVVLENIVRLREKGIESDQAALDGTEQVWGALVASTATTVAIFLPIVFLRDIAGQLFADLALAIAIAVVASLIIAVTIIPTAATAWLRNVELKDPHQSWWRNGTRLVMRLTDTPARRTGWIVGLSLAALGLTATLLPETDYLPEGKQNFLFGVILPPPGISVESAKEEIAAVINERLMPFLDGERQPAIQNYFLGLFGRFGFMGARAEDRADVDELVQIFNGEILRGLPDTMAFVNRASIFGRLGGGRSIDVNIQSRDIDAMLGAAMVGMGAISQAMPGAQVRPIPGVELADPELRLIPRERRIVESGWDRQTIARVIRALGDGLYVGDYFDGNERLDVILRGAEWSTPEQLMATPIVTPDGNVQPLGELVALERTAGPDQIRRVDRRRTITLEVTPPADMPLGPAIDLIKQEVDPAIRERLPDDGDISYQGTADDKDTAIRNMAQSLALAIAILYLLMSALFRSFRDSLLVILALPLAIVGGVVSLRITNLLTFQPMDLLTMIGFITLTGLVVNNAILLVHQTRKAERDGVRRRDAVEQAVRYRLRPILMSTLTSLFGMLPLLLMPGAGTELYRGLAAVIVGGMSVSTLFTLILLPSLLRIGETATAPEPATTAAAHGQYAQRHSSL